MIIILKQVNLYAHKYVKLFNSKIN